MVIFLQNASNWKIQTKPLHLTRSQFPGSKPETKSCFEDWNDGRVRGKARVRITGFY